MWTFHCTTIQVLTPSVRVATRMPGAPVPSRSVQYGASTPLGGVGSGSVWGSNVMSLALSLPPTEM